MGTFYVGIELLQYYTSFFVGSDPGAATRMKLIINMVMGSVVASLSEGMAMAEKVGLDLEDVAEVLSLGSLCCPTIVHKSQGKLRSLD
jgi:3-hydroxyisobutyrate dehydrogenase-like beta-hydroxyacid dehydrogenase